VSEHSIEELKRQLQAAHDRAKQADDEVRAAQKRLQAAINEASGVLGHVLEFTQSRGCGRKRQTLTRRIVVDKVGPSWRREDGDEAHGFYVIASGAMGQMRGRVLIKDAKDLGPYPLTTPTASSS
jgi:hypothetical protein